MEFTEAPFDSTDANDPIASLPEPDEKATARNASDGTLWRYGNVIVADKSKRRMSFRNNEDAVKAMRGWSVPTH